MPTAYPEQVPTQSKSGIVSELSNVETRLNQIVDRLRAFDDRLSGPRPESMKSMSGNQKEGSVLPVKTQINRIQELLTHAESSVSRIENSF